VALRLSSSAPLRFRQLCGDTLVQLEPYSNDLQVSFMAAQVREFKLCRPEYSLWFWQSPSHEDLQALSFVLLQAKLEVHNIKAVLLRKSQIVHKVPKVKPVKEKEIQIVIEQQNCTCDDQGLFKKLLVARDAILEYMTVDTQGIFNDISRYDLQGLFITFALIISMQVAIYAGKIRIPLKIVKQLKDGNCLFRCVSHQLYGDPEHHMLIRRYCVEFMRLNPVTFMEFMVEDIDDYLKKMSQAKTWGDQLEIIAISKLYSRNFEVYESTTADLLHFFDAFSTENPIRVFYENKTHYDSVVPVTWESNEHFLKTVPGEYEKERIAKLESN
jgi:hypothetical protein